MLADGLAIHGSVVPSVLEEAAKQYVSRVEAYCRKASPTKRRSAGAALSPDEETVLLLRGLTRRFGFLVEIFCKIGKLL